MSADLEIIEVDTAIIEISDDDSLYEEESKDFLVLGNISETATTLNVNEESTDDHEGIEKHLPRNADNTSKIVISQPITLVNADHVDIYLEDTIGESADSNSNVDCTDSSQINEIPTQYNHTESSSLHSDTPIFENEEASNLVGNKGARIRTGNIKKNQNTAVRNSQCNRVSKVVKKSATVQKAPNSLRNVNHSEINDSTLPDQRDKVRPTCSNLRNNTNFNFSKLKWLKPLKSLSSPPNLQIVIVDRNHPAWRIKTDKWLMIEKRLLEALNNEMLRTNDTSIGLFDGAKWQNGVKIIGCHNENAFDFITKFIINLDKLWIGADLYAFSMSYITRHVIKVYIPPPTLKTELMMSLIKLQNPSISTDDWEIVKEHERANNGGVDIWISIDNESFTQLRRLRGEIKYGINRIFMNPSK